MTWGSNPTGAVVRCHYCGGPMLDDGNPPSHYLVCPMRYWWRRPIPWPLWIGWWIMPPGVFILVASGVFGVILGERHATWALIALCAAFACLIVRAIVDLWLGW